MVTLLSDKEGVVINGEKFGYEDFYDAFYKAISNSDDYYYTQRACKQHKIGDSGKSIGLIPQSESRNIDFIPRNASEDRIFQVHDLSTMCVDSFISARDLYFLVAESERYTTEELKNGDVLEHPDIWQRQGEELVLNETFRIRCDTASFAIESLLERASGSDIAKFRFGDHRGRKCCFKYLSENSPTECTYCGSNEEMICIDKLSGSSYIYCSGVCLGCLPDFMSNYLNYDRNEVSSIIVANHM